MNRKIAIIALPLGLFLPHTAAPDPAPVEKIGVVATILPYAYFAERVGGEAVEVSVMVPPGANPHSYEPAPRQLDALGRARLYVKAGTGIEFELAWMDKLTALNRTMRVCDASRGIAPLGVEGECGHAEERGRAHGAVRGRDPHVWLSPANAAVIAENIRAALAEIDPARAEAYAANARALRAELDRLDGEVAAALLPARGKTFFVFHPAWSYFAARYGLVQAPIEAGGKEPGARGFAASVKRARELGANAVFASPESSRRGAEVVAREIGGRVIVIDPLARNYPENLRRVAAALAEEAR
ncbi:MAG TPA: zinc ABC transporter substrate-binding protein [bacterium]|nr:zinc ABC transporter solute-binding protein [Chlamydiota bacterium]HOE28051.1 zinc ABC transporter substrate-binding protein [bacterium]HQM53261.1 zinc ABC transporter substrate-binding protein [bacterium]